MYAKCTTNRLPLILYSLILFIGIILLLLLFDEFLLFLFM